jgi:hypothetical protein
MTIVSGTVRVDLSRHVQLPRLLFIGPAAYRELWDALGGANPQLGVELDIGSAEAVAWHDRRGLELLALMSRITVTGTCAAGVDMVAALITEAAAAVDAA